MGVTGGHIALAYLGPGLEALPYPGIEVRRQEAISVSGLGASDLCSVAFIPQRRLVRAHVVARQHVCVRHAAVLGLEVVEHALQLRVLVLAARAAHAFPFPLGGHHATEGAAGARQEGASIV